MHIVYCILYTPQSGVRAYTPARDHTRFEGFADLQTLQVWLRKYCRVLGLVLYENLHREGLNKVSVRLGQIGEGFKLKPEGGKES
jgi:hypothetical protein